LVGSPQPNYTFSNAFSGSTGLDTNSYFYTANNGDVSGAVLSKDVGLAAFADLTATVTPLPEPPLAVWQLVIPPIRAHPVRLLLQMGRSFKGQSAWVY
jgi:hypothetical protein